MAFSQGIGWGIGKHRGRAIEKDFVMEVDTTIAGALPDNQFQLRTHVGQGYTVNYDLTTSDGQSFTGLTNNQTITFPAPGVYTLKITGTFPGTNYGANNESKKIVDIKNWGKIQWRRAYSAFENAQNLTTFSASDYPDFSLLDGTGMRQMFQNCTNINADFSKWDVSTVATFDRAFNLCSSFNNDSVCNWDTSASVQFNNCFNGCTVFDQDLSNWNVSNATSFGDMFLNAYAYNNGGQALTWTLGSGAISLTRMFGNTSFNQDISGWGTSSVLSMSSMFQGSAFNNPSINNWDTSSVTTMRYLFAGTPFNQDISGWDVSSVTDVYTMFNGQFNQPIGAWNLTSCTNLESMFYGAYAFEQDLSAWDVSGVTKMTATFSNMGASERSLNIGGWNTSSVENMESLLYSTRITDDLSGWDVSSCTNFQTLTPYGKIYFDLSLWAIQGPVNLNNMIRDTYTDQSIVDQWNFKDWDISQCISLGTQFALLETLTTNNYDQTLISWAAQAPVNALTAHFGFSKYTLGGLAEAARNTLINTYGWTIIDGGGIAAPFAFTVQTDNAGTSAANQFTIPITSATPYNIKTSDGQSITGATGATTLTFPSAGEYEIKISESCSGFTFNIGGDRLKLKNISSWGVFTNDVQQAFRACSNMTCSAVDAPLNPPTTMLRTFYDCPSFNGAVGNWDVSQVSIFQQTFFNSGGFDQPLNNWDVSNGSTFYSIFENTSFSQPLDNWTLNTSISINCFGMFSGTNFNNPSINNWNTSSVFNMSWMFANCPFNQDISGWDVSGVTNMSNMFDRAASFNQPIGSWNVSNVTNFGSMFSRASSFNQPIGSWNTGSANSLNAMFAALGQASSFNQPIDSWDVSTVVDMRSVFSGATAFNQPLNNWDTSGCTTMISMFENAQSFNQDLNNWNVLKVSGGNFGSMFQSCSSFNGSLAGWTFPQATTLDRMFNGAIAFNNSSIASWDISNITKLTYTFRGCTNFDVDISGWNTSNVNDMIELFQNCSSFNQPIGNWDVSKVTRFNYFLFNASSFNQPLNNWDVSSCTTFSTMFYGASSFNQDIGDWDMSSTAFGSGFKEMFRSATAYNNGGQPINWITSPGVTDMTAMFYNCFNFKQSLYSINITTLSNKIDFNNLVVLPTESYNATLIGWNSQLEAAYPGGAGYSINLGWNFNGSTYAADSAAEAARTNLINTFGWTIVDGGAVAEAFEFTVDTSIAAGGHSANNQYQLPLSATGTINATVNWGDGNSDTITSYTDAAALHTYATTGTYNISIDGQISDFNIVGGAAAQTFDDRRKLRSIEKWGQFEIVATDTFYWAINFTSTPLDAPKISTANLARTFRRCWTFNGYTDAWDMSGVTSLESFFNEALVYNKPVSSWQVNNVTNFNGLFFNAQNFNQPVNSWDTSSVNDITGVFRSAFDFNKPLDNWNTSNVSACQLVFAEARSFNQDISGWDTSSWLFPQTIFQGALVFNQPVGLWDATSWAGYRQMFDNCPAFDQDLSSYPPTKSNIGQFLGGTSALSPLNYGKLLDVWSQGIVSAGLTWDMGGSTYYFDGRGEAGKNSLVSTYSLTFLDGGAVYALDNVPAPSVAYSLRQLKTGVTNVARVRRDSDNAEQDFTASQVTDGTLTTFVGAGNGYVHTLYDQSGNGNNAVSTNPLTQPLVVVSGVLVTENGKPMLDYTAVTANNLTITTPIAYTNSAYTFFGNGTKVSSIDAAFLGGAGGSFELRFGSGSSITALRAGQQNLGGMNIPANTGHYAVSCRVNQTRPVYVANTTSGSGLYAGSFTQPITQVGSVSSSGESFKGKMGDFILYDTDQWSNQITIQDAINDYYLIY